MSYFSLSDILRAEDFPRMFRHFISINFQQNPETSSNIYNSFCFKTHLFKVKTNQYFPVKLFLAQIIKLKLSFTGEGKLKINLKMEYRELLLFYLIFVFFCAFLGVGKFTVADCTDISSLDPFSIQEKP
jgi:hypothetical protein